jgi:hypothetical protein
MLITIDVMGEEDDVVIDVDSKERNIENDKKIRLAKEELVRRQTQMIIVEVT